MRSLPRGRPVTWFEEWPYWPGRPYSAGDDLA
jgi:hypothetical protein